MTSTQPASEMSVPHPSGDPNAALYRQLKRDVLDRVPQITTVQFVPDPIEARSLRATFDPVRLEPETGPQVPVLEVIWYRGRPRDWFQVDFSDPNVEFHAGWHQDEDHPDLGPAHAQYAVDGESDRWSVSFDHRTPSLVCWDILEQLLLEVLPTYHPNAATG